MLPRILTAAVALTAALVITPRLVPQPTVSQPTMSPPLTARMAANDSAPLAPPPVAAGTPLEPMASLPDPVRQDLADFATSQGLETAAGLRGWANDLNGDGRDDLLVEADFGRDAAGRPVIYHFPYFAQDAGFRRGSALSLAEPITEMGRDGRALIIGLDGRRLRLAF